MSRWYYSDLPKAIGERASKYVTGTELAKVVRHALAAGILLSSTWLHSCQVQVCSRKFLRVDV